MSDCKVPSMRRTKVTSPSGLRGIRNSSTSPALRPKTRTGVPFSTPCIWRKPARRRNVSAHSHCRLPTAKRPATASTSPASTDTPRIVACQGDRERDTGILPFLRDKPSQPIIPVWRIRRSRLQGDVTGRHIFHENAVALQTRENSLDFRPLTAELLLFVGLPIGHDLLREIGGPV